MHSCFAHFIEQIMHIISVIIPTYNPNEKLIDTTLKSILSQSFRDYEILIVDNNTISEEFKNKILNLDSRISVYSEPDKGVYDAMNKGVLKAKGEWLYFLGDTDFMDNDFVFEKATSQISSEEYDFVYGDTIESETKIRTGGETTREELFLDKNICHQGILYNKRIFQRLGLYNLDFKVLSDWDLNLRCFSTPDIRTKYLDLVFAHNDSTGGLSKNPYADIPYIKVSAIRLKCEMDNLMNSREYRWGRAITAPLKKLKRMFSR